LGNRRGLHRKFAVFRLAHISDLHLSRLPATTWAQLANKRLLGYLSWHLRRRRQHLGTILDALVADLHAVDPDHVAITGDLVNLALPGEFVEAAAWLRRLGPPERISVVPGNHDALVPVLPADGWDHLRAYATSDPEVHDGGQFPFLRRRGPLAIVGLSSAYPSPPGWATGRLGADQLARLAHLLGSLGGDGRCRVVLMHHSPVDGVSRPRRRLIDAAPLRRCIAEHGADIVLHGHEHAFRYDQIVGADGLVPVFGVPSASQRSASATQVAQYCVYGIEGDAQEWRIVAERRVFAPTSQRFVSSERRILVREKGALTLHLEPVVATCHESA
jgi:3',5'-cyclic AMP phosphodiesterase CpdA